MHRTFGLCPCSFFLEGTKGRIKIFIPFFSPFKPPNKSPNLTPRTGCKIGCKYNKSLIIRLYCGERGIRTPGGVTLNGFQDRRNRPLCHLSMTATVYPSIVGAKLDVFFIICNSMVDFFWNYSLIRLPVSFACNFRIGNWICLVVVGEITVG